VSKKLLVAIYAIVPLSLCAVFLDTTLLDGFLKSALPMAPNRFWWFVLIFNVPHIISSEVILFDREYLREYKRHLWIGAGISIVLLEAVTFSLPRAGLQLFVTVIVSYHIFAQQIGMTRSLVPRTGREFAVWKWLGVTIGIASLIGPKRFVGDFGPPLLLIASLAMIPFCAVCIVVLRRCQDRVGATFVLANQLMFVSLLPLSYLGYGFFAMLMPRVAHDLTAYAFYIAHDTNRNRDEAHNWIYRGLRFTRLPVWFLSPALGMGIACAIGLGGIVGLHMAGILSMFHYYMESVTWKRGTPHRREIAFV
jgi:hypothetical protein